MSELREPHAARLRSLQRRMAADGLAGALLTLSRDVFYYTGTAQPAWLGVTPSDYVLFVRAGEAFAARDTGLGEDRLVPERRPRAVVARLFGGAPDGPVATELDMMPVNAFQVLEAAVAPQRIVDVSPMVLHQRGVKEADEIAAVRRAAAALDAGHQAAVKGWRPGMSELIASAIAEDGMRRAGHEGAYFLRAPDFTMGRGPLASGPAIGDISGVVFTVSGSGLSPAVPAGASRRVMEEGDLVIMDIPTCVEGYHADQTRTYSLGRPPAAARELHARLRDVADVMMHELRPGMAAGDACRIAFESAEIAGIGDALMAFPDGRRAHFVGHGVGLEINEPPFLAKGVDMELRDGMVLAIELHACAAGGPMVKLEDTVVLGDDGCRVLTQSPRELAEIL